MEGRTAWNNYTFLIQQQKTYTMLISKNHFVMRMFQMKKQFFFYGNFQVTSFWIKKNTKVSNTVLKTKIFCSATHPTNRQERSWRNSGSMLQSPTVTAASISSESSEWYSFFYLF